MATTPELTVVEDEEKLEQHRPEWLDLLARSEQPSPTLTPDWLLTWWSVFGKLGRRRLRVGLFHSENRLVGLAPLMVRWHWYRSLIPFRRVELLGTGEDEDDEICSEYIGVVVEHGLEAAVARALAEALANGRFGSWDELVMPAMNGDACFPQVLGAELDRLGIPTSSQATTRSPYIPLPATWQAYLGMLSGSHRGLLRRSIRAFESWTGGQHWIESVGSPSEIDRGYRILRDLHAERWNERRAGGSFASPRFSEFHRDILPKLLAAGSLDLLWLVVRGEPVAVQYNLVHAGKVYFYQGGRKLDVPAGIRPGTVLHAYAIQRAIAAGRSEYDFLAGTQRYKIELSLASRSILELRAARPAMREAARRAAEAGATRIRERYRTRASASPSSSRA